MIGPDDIDAFRDDLEACREGVRRYKKGLPEDRWHDGVLGHARFMRAVNRMLILHEATAQMMAGMLADLQSRGADSMEPHRDPCRND